MQMPHYLYVSFLGQSSGLGHVMRAFACARQCIALGHLLDITFTSCEDKNTGMRKTLEYEALLHMHSDIINHPNVRIVSNLTQYYDAIFLDVQKLDYKRFCFYQKYGFCIGIDLSGKARECVPYLIDTLPNTLSPPNVYDPAGFVDAMIPKRKTLPRQCKHVLVYAVHTMYEQYRFVLEECVKHNIRCTVVISPFCESEKHEEDVQSLHARCPHDEFNVSFVSLAPNLAHMLYEYDLVITHFGLTAFEALYAKVPTVLVNPSAYHTLLSKRAGFLYHYRSYMRAAKLLACFASDENSFHAAADAMTDIHKVDQWRSLSVYDRLLTCADKIKSWYRQQNPVNPFDVSNERMPIALWRDEEKSIFICKKTKLMFQIPFVDPVTYDNAYFFSEYKAQYGRTYLEDFDAICNKADNRLDCIEHIIDKNQSIKRDVSTLRLVDLGCAYGAMLTRAQARGFISCGVDISKDACAYVQNTLKIPTLCASIFHDNFHLVHASFVEKYTEYFQTNKQLDTGYDVLSCCYVLEHTPHFNTAINNISRLLKTGGIFVLAVPNGRGISARRYFTSFLRANPIDHFSIFSPKSLIKLLHTRGFAVRALRITGNHPSRFFPSALQWILHPSVQCIVRMFSKLFHLGDTFELYLEKTS